MFIKHSLHKRQKNRPLFSTRRAIFLEGEPAPKETTEKLKPIDVFYHIESFIDQKKEKVNIQKALDVMKALDPETKKRLHFLTPPVFSYTDVGQPQLYQDGYKIRINITDTPANIKKALEQAAAIILSQPRFLRHADKEYEAEKAAMEKGLPFKNIRQAFSEDLKRGKNPKINWNDQNAEPFPPYTYVQPDSGQQFNCAVEMPAETTARLEKLRQARAIRAQAKREIEEQKAADEQARAAAIEEASAAEEAAEAKRIQDEIDNREASEEEEQELDTALAAFNEKKKTVSDKYGITLSAHTKYDRPYNAKKIAGEAQRLNKLTTALDRFGPVFGGLSKDTQNILILLTLVIDHEKSDKKIDGKDNKYWLSFSILNSDEKIKKDLIDRKNMFVKGGKKFEKDTDAEAAERTAAKAKKITFKNCREAYNIKPDKSDIMYDKDADKWEPSTGRGWTPGASTYNYATVEKSAEAPPPAPERPPETTEYVAAPTDTIEYINGKILTKQLLKGKNKFDEFTLTTEDKMYVYGNIRIKYGSYGNVNCLRLYSDAEYKNPVVDIFLDKDGKIRTMPVKAYIAAIDGSTITVKKR